MMKFENVARQNKTSKANRTNYVYYTADGEKLMLSPAEIGDAWIAYLHDVDDQEVNANRREEYRVQMRFSGQEDWLQRNRNSAVTNESKDNPRFSDVALEDKSYMDNPLEKILNGVEATSYENRLKKLQEAIKTLQPQQQALIQKVFYEKRTKVDIAAEEGVTEAAIRNRLKKIYANLAKKLKK